MTLHKSILFAKNHTLEIVGLVVIGVLLFLFASSPRGLHITQQFFDPIRTTQPREEAVIIGIDDKSLQTIGAWPFDRNVFADVTKKLDAYGAKVIIYDVLFLEPRHGDDAFKDVLSEVHTPVALASKIENGRYLSSFLANTSNPFISSALSNVDPDDDGKVRKYPSFTTQNGKCVVGLGEQAFRIVTFKNDAPCEDKSLNYFRYPTSIAVYSLVDVLSGTVPLEKLRGKVVFIGSTSLDLEDHFVGISGEKIPGVYVHASIFTSLLNKEGDRVLSNTEIISMLLLFMILTLILLYYAKTILSQVIATLFIILSVFIVAYAFFLTRIMIPAPWLVLDVLVTGGYVTLFRFLKEKKRSEYVQSLFSKYVHKDVLKELMKSSESLHFEGERREVTVLFSDLRGFTTLSESLSPEALTKLLNGYFSAMTPAILNEKGTIDKFIGDAIMAFWNAPLQVADHATCAVRAAVHMQTSLDEFNTKHSTSLRMGIGIHKGDVIVGNVGSEERINYTILGDTVNLASRVEGLTKKYGVVCIVTEAVRNSVHDEAVLFRKLDVITVKGKSEHTILYEAKTRTKEQDVICKRYEEGFELYFRGEFEKAKIIFKELVDMGDKPSSVLLERIASINRTVSFDGVWHFDEK